MANRFRLPEPFSTKQSSQHPQPVEILPSQYLIAKSCIEFGPQVGRGRSATVYKGKFNSQNVAIKVYSIDNTSVPANKNLILKEAAEIIALSHDNIIKCHVVCIDAGAIVMELTKKVVETDGIQFSIHSVRQLIDTISKENLSPLLK